MARKFDREFKEEAIRLSSEPGNSASQVERNLGLPPGYISRWKRQLANKGKDAFPGKGRLSEEQDRIRRLERELERTKRERDILKKAVAIFSEDPQRYSGS